MRADKTKLDVAMARACMNPADLVFAAKMPESTVKNVLTGKNVRPGTIGRIAKVLRVDVIEILKQEAL